ncbi:TonB-dependent receptor domain-containing protein [Zunongwangia sp. HRR-M8]|uniref:TonB-dependent receptor domain-containing protein n=1 Tax=Zunongwangia sp. HRR-M8 TaxID=3015170 RepID=UPI0022DE9179|nr:TonB-dependent receptor [Zunongwangia sp. HRR-M8]WBL21383.1 TonB-dependent receptor [Zunongwangia sp. HRR-M8]
MKQLFVIIILTLSSFHSVANNEPFARISGTIMDLNLQEPVPYATISLQDTEGKIITGTTSEEDGSFIIKKVKPGNYTLGIQFIGYNKFSKEIEITRNSGAIDLGIINLEAAVAEMDEVTVVGERSTIEQRIDRKIINVGKDLTTTGATASEIMNNVPSVNVDQDGNIALRGNSNVRILIDGKPTNMDPAQLLKQIPSTSIKKIELITNPSAKYNPEGMSGIINIVLHKNANNGFNGNLNTGLTYGENARLNGSLDLNYRQGKFNFYANLGSNFGKRQNINNINLVGRDAKQNLDMINDNNSYIYKVGVDYFLDDNNTFSFYTNQNVFDGGLDATINAIYLNNPSNSFDQLLNIDFESNNATYNFAYKHLFAKEGHEILFEADYNDYDGNEDFTANFSENASFDSYTEDVNEDRGTLITNIDYTLPIGERSKFEAGAEARILKNEQDYDTNNPLAQDSDYSYDRNIYSLYGTFGQNYEKFSYQIGARLESFDIDAEVYGENVFEDDYITLYPSGFFNYTPNEKNTYQISYSRRIDRPSLSQVSLVRQISTPTITVLGNPDLQPQFTNSIEFNYTRNLKNGSFTGGVFFRNINDNINQLIEEDPSDPASLFISFANFDDTNAYGVELSSNYKFTEWWSANGSFELYQQTQSGVVGSDFVEVDNTVYTARINNSFSVTEDLTLQLFGFYRGPSQELQFKNEDVFFANIGGRYSFLDNKATVSLNFNDVFGTQEYKFSTTRPYEQNGIFKSEFQNVYVGFSYRFGGNNAKKLKRKQRDNDEAQGGGMF